jgi:ubiquinone/menaquinone biosynthesis C-methylase UbiE
MRETVGEEVSPFEGTQRNGRNENRNGAISQMPTLAQNVEMWNDPRNWSYEGDVWSVQFGGTEAMWWFVVYPRIHRYLPAANILEIAPGYGRWTQFLRNLCQSLVAVDLSETCIEHCKSRFSDSKHLSFYVNDGSSLSVVPDGTIDFLFSFDSLVHAEKDVIESYVLQFSKKLKPDGVGFVHHSNLGAYPGRLRIFNTFRRLPLFFQQQILKEKYLERLLSINVEGWRAKSMTAKLFGQYCEQSGLKCISQELVNWFKGTCLIDSFSVFTKPGSRWDKEFVRMENNKFVNNTTLTSRLARLYTR